MKRIIAFLFALGFMASAAGLVINEHVSEALEYTRQAVVHGKAGHAPPLVEKASAALVHAQKAAAKAQGRAKTHLDAAVKSLERAIAYGQVSHAAMATEPAEAAIKHLEASIQSSTKQP